MPETHIVTPEAVGQAELDRHFSDAAERVADQMFEPEFHALLGKAGIDINDSDPSLYWQKMAEYTARKTGSNSELSSLEKHTTQLIGFLPNTLLQEYHLRFHKDLLSEQEIRSAKRTACTYNNLLKDFVRTYPQDAEHLKQNLLGGILQTVGGESIDFNEFTNMSLDTTLRGVKHEVGFGVILDTLGVEHRDATISEDLRGRDLVIMFNGHEIGIDVKASLDQVDGKNHGSENMPYAVKHNGDVVMFSMLLEKDFAGGFTPTSTLVSELAPQAGGYLHQALMHSIAKKHI